MNVPKETLELIQETAQKAQKAQLLDIRGDGRTAYVQLDGKLQMVPIEPAPRNHLVCSLADLLAFAERCRDDDTADPVVWPANDEVVLIINDADRRDRVTFSLEQSEPFEALWTLRKSRPTPLDLRSFIRLLRITLGLDNQRVVDQFRKLEWKLQDGTSAEVQHTKESMGKAIMAEVQGVDDLPDELVVQVPVYRDAGERTPIDIACAIEIDARNQTLELMPLPGEVERALQLAQADIQGRLMSALPPAENEASDVPVYYGSPVK